MARRLSSRRFLCLHMCSRVNLQLYNPAQCPGFTEPPHSSGLVPSYDKKTSLMIDGTLPERDFELILKSRAADSMTQSLEENKLLLELEAWSVS